MSSLRIFLSFFVLSFIGPVVSRAFMATPNRHSELNKPLLDDNIIITNTTNNSEDITLNSIFIPITSFNY